MGVVSLLQNGLVFEEVSILSQVIGSLVVRKCVFAVCDSSFRLYDRRLELVG